MFIQSPLPWEGRIKDFYNDDVIANPNPVMGSFAEGNAAVASYTSYPSIGLVAVGWSAFIWFLIWFSIFRGVGMTGRVVYFTMGVPIITTLIIVGRATSLENAGVGIRLVWATWRGDQLKSGTVWQTAVGQVFFSTGIGFGYFTSYASYNAKHSNAVIDAILICFSNVVFENVAAFAVFGIAGFLRLWPKDGVRLGAFVVGFLTLPEAILHLPGANFWAVLLFLTLIVLGFSSAFVLIDAAATLVMDSGVKISRPVVVTSLTLLSFLLCLPYCTQFGYYLLDGVDRWVNNILLIFVVWAEVVSATSVYRWSDVVSQTGVLAFATYNVGYLGAQIIGVSVAYGLGNPGPGAGAGFGFYSVVSLIATLLSNAPDVNAPSFWNSNSDLARLWYLAFYSGNQLRRDLNVVVGVGKNWTIPSFLPVLLRYVSGPTLAIILSFAYTEFYKLRYDPLMITGFTLTHILLAAPLLGFIIPRYYDVFIPPSRLGEGTEVTVVGQSKIDVPEIKAGHEDSIEDIGSVPSEEMTGPACTKSWRTKS
ncbi:hypothetical protein RRF57_003526 [Xylaria bambusicola]|uniref:SNF-domain-containing protein n=1 Tax=Xylaria bambusicola TaxID=326684 RepID=A0AAN7UKC9_9PEZI